MLHKNKCFIVGKIIMGLYWWLRRQWHPTPVLLPGKSHGRKSLVGCSPWGRWELDATQWLHFHFSLLCIGEGNGNPLQCSCLENPRDSGAWWAAVYGVAQSRTRLKQLSSQILPSRLHFCSSHSFWARIASPDPSWKLQFPLLIQRLITFYHIQSLPWISRHREWTHSSPSNSGSKLESQQRLFYSLLPAQQVILVCNFFLECHNLLPRPFISHC